MLYLKGIFLTTIWVFDIHCSADQRVEYLDDYLYRTKILLFFLVDTDQDIRDR